MTKPPGAGKGPKIRLKKRRHNWRCASAKGDRCNCRCRAKFHGSGFTGIRD